MLNVQFNLVELCFILNFFIFVLIRLMFNQLEFKQFQFEALIKAGTTIQLQSQLPYSCIFHQISVAKCV